jgi:hypothetical protein
MILIQLNKINQKAGYNRKLFYKKKVIKTKLGYGLNADIKEKRYIIKITKILFLNFYISLRNKRTNEI